MCASCLTVHHDGSHTHLLVFIELAVEPRASGAGVDVLPRDGARASHQSASRAVSRSGKLTGVGMCLTYSS